MNQDKTNYRLELLKIVATFHTLTTPILIGFFSLLNKTPENKMSLSTNPNIFVGGAVAIGLVLYFLTFIVLFKSFDEQKKELDFKQIKWGFWMSFATIAIFVILIISQVIVQSTK